MQNNWRWTMELSLLTALRALDLEFREGDLYMDGSPAPAGLRESPVDELVSSVSALPEVRAAMLERQRAFGWSGGGVVMEGRDIGSVVLPLARCKVFLTATVEERARRRVLQSGRAVNKESITEVTAQLRERDERDSTRKHSPLQLSPRCLLPRQHRSGSGRHRRADPGVCLRGSGVS